MACSRERRFCRVGIQQLGAEFGEVDFLRVGCALGVFAQDHGAGQVLDGLFDDVGEDAHHGCGLVFAEAFVAEALHEFKSVEVVVAEEWFGGVEGAGRCDEGRGLVRGGMAAATATAAGEEGGEDAFGKVTMGDEMGDAFSEVVLGLAGGEGSSLLCSLS